MRFTKPNLVFIAFVRRWEAQLCWSGREEPTLLVGDFVEYAEFFLVIGMTALNAAKEARKNNCRIFCELW